MQWWNRCGVSVSRWLLARNFSNKLFVGGLSYDTNETILKSAFEQHGEIIEVKIICDHVSGKSKGYGFVQFTSESAASMALKEMNGQLLDGRNIRLFYAQKRCKHGIHVELLEKIQELKSQKDLVSLRLIEKQKQTRS